MPLVSHQTIRNLLPTHLIDANTAPEITRQVADNVVEASLKGHDSHGVTLLPRYLKAIQAGELNPHGEWRILRDEGPLLSFHGEHGFGQHIGYQTMVAGIARAQQYGVAIVGVAESHHPGRIGAWAEQVAAAGLVSLHFANVCAAPLAL